MKRIRENEIYLSDIACVKNLSLDWGRLKNSVFLISGASGMVGSFLIDLLLGAKAELGIRVIAMVRNESRARDRFAEYLEAGSLTLLCGDLNEGVPDFDGSVDYVLHAASNTHPRAYATAPIQTLMTNVIGTDNMLRCALKHGAKRFLFLSSVEVYGENRGDVERFSEDYCGYLDCNTLRAGYPEGKRAGEALCQAYIKEKGMDIVIPRLSRTYGPTMLLSDTKAISQFIKNGVARENIVLKSKGTQFYSYSYVADAVSALLYCLLLGKTGEAYNIADVDSDISLAGLAEIIASHAGKQVVFELPDEVEQAGYSKATKAALDSSKLQSLGWKAQFGLKAGLEHTISILQYMQD